LRNFSSMVAYPLQAAIRRGDRIFHLTATRDSASEYKDRENAACESRHIAKNMCAQAPQNRNLGK
jgi:hypothetical protein